MPLAQVNWNYHERQDKQGQGVISSWEDTLSVKAQARLERALDQLKQLPKPSWSKPAPASHIGDHTYVIRFKDVTSLPLRVFGHFYDLHEVFVMTFNGYEKDNVYYPPDYQALAQRHRATCDASFLGTTLQYKHHCSICIKSTEPITKRRH
jgi:hypothetical protein